MRSGAATRNGYAGSPTQMGMNLVSASLRPPTCTSSEWPVAGMTEYPPGRLYDAQVTSSELPRKPSRSI